MTMIESLDTLRTLAKKLARTRRIKHFSALELVAQQLGYPHWNALTADHKKGWHPSSTHIAAIQGLVHAANPLSAKTLGTTTVDPLSQIPGIALKATSSQPKNPADAFSAEDVLGELDGFQFHLSVVLDDVIIEGRGWRIVVPEAPSASPEISVTDRRIKSNPILEESFAKKALRAAQIRAEQVRARIATDWPRRSTLPDPNGHVEHPLFGDVSDKWFCLHCDEASTGKQMAENFWHCSSCGASPIDIHMSRWWRGEAAVSGEGGRPD